MGPNEFSAISGYLLFGGKLLDVVLQECIHHHHHYYNSRVYTSSGSSIIFHLSIESSVLPAAANNCLSGVICMALTC